MNRRHFFNMAIAGIGAFAGVGVGMAQAMPVSSSFRPASGLGYAGALAAGEDAHVEKAAVLVRVVRRRRVVVRPRRVIVRRVVARRRVLRRL